MIVRIVAAIFCNRDDPDDDMETRLKALLSVLSLTDHTPVYVCTLEVQSIPLYNKIVSGSQCRVCDVFEQTNKLIRAKSKQTAGELAE